MSMSIKKSRLFKLLAVAALVVVMAIGTALPSFASSEDKKLYFQTTGNAYEVCIPTAQLPSRCYVTFCRGAQGWNCEVVQGVGKMEKKGTPNSPTVQAL